MTWTSLDILWLARVMLWAAWCTQAVLGALLTRKLRRRWHAEPAVKEQAFQPPCVLIVPVKGVDDRFEDRLLAVEMAVNGATTLTGGQGDVAHGGLLKAEAFKNLACPRQDVLFCVHLFQTLWLVNTFAQI